MTGAGPLDLEPEPHAAGHDGIDRPADQVEGDDDREWRWVTEWRSSREPVAWGPGSALAAFTVVLVAVAIFVLTGGVADKPWLAVALNVVVAGGIAPQLWLARNLPVVRFVAWGAAIGVLAGWAACLVVPFPA